jgi:hypothetical protein
LDGLPGHGISLRIIELKENQIKENWIQPKKLFFHLKSH